MIKYYFTVLLFILFSTVKAQINIPDGTLVTENFNSIGASAAASLPANWKMSSAGTGGTSNWTSGTNITATTQAAGSGTPATGGAYNWATTGGIDRAIGFMTDGGYVSPNSIMAFYRNTTGTTVSTITVSFGIERYRINTSAFNLSFFSSTDGSTWTSRTVGDISSAVFITAANSYTFTAPQTVYKTVTITGLSIANNGDFYLRWLLNTGSSNSQGIALDDVMIYAGAATPAISATLRDALTIDNGIPNQANAGDQLTYTTVIKNTGTGDANGVNFTDPAPANTTLVAGSVTTSALARDDSYATAFNTVLTGGNVLTNDFGIPSPSVISFGPVKNAAITAAGGTGSSDNGGTVILNANGTFTYTPPAGFTGIDKFAYIAATGTLPDNDAVVTVSVGTAAGSVNDSYNIIGNVSISPNVGMGLLANDAGSNMVLIAVNGNAANVGTAIITAQGGNLTVNANGSFTYNPPKGFEGTDNFTYTVDNGFATASTASVTLNISGMIWFVNNTAAAGGDGRLSAPFNSIAALQSVNNGTGNNPALNDYIFIYESATDYSGPLTLLNGQKLVGQDATASLASITGFTVQAYSAALPVMNSGNGTIVNITTTVASTNAVILNSIAGSNLLRGLTIGNKTGIGIMGSGFGTCTASDISITGTGQALQLNNGTVSATFNSISSTSSVNAIVLTTVAGTLTVNGGSISGATGTTFSVDGGSVSITWAGSLSQSNNAALVNIIGTHSGTITFQTGTLSATNGTGLQFGNADGVYNFNGTTTLNGGDAGVDITDGSSGSFTFSTATSITNPSGPAFVITASNCNGTYSGNITDNSGFIVDVTNFNAGTFTFQTGTFNSTAQGIRFISSSGGTINFDNTSKVLSTGANVAVTLTNNAGSTINFRNGGLIITTTSGAGFNATAGAAAVTVTGTGNTITSTTGTPLNVVNTTIGASGLNFQSISANGAVNGIVLNNTGSNGGLTVTGIGSINSGGTIQNCSGDGISLNNCQNISLTRMNITANLNSGIFGDALTNFSLISCNITNNTNAVGGTEANLRCNNLLGNCVINACTISGAFEDNIRLTPSSGVLSNLQITGTTIGPNSPTTGGNGITIISSGTAIMTVNISSGCVFTGSRLSGIATTVNGTSLTLSVSGCIFTDNNSGVDLGNGTNSDVTYTVTNCTFLRQNISPINALSSFTSTNAADFRLTITNNTIGDGTSNSGSALSFGIVVDMQGDVTARVLISGNNVRNTDIEGIFVQSRLDNDADAEIGRLDLTLTNNTVGVPDDNTAFPFFFVYGIRIESRNTTKLTMNMSGNTSSGVGGAEHIRLRQRDTSQFLLERLTDGDATPNEVLNNTALINSFVIAQNNVGTTSSVTLVAGFTEAANGVTLLP